MTTPRTAAGPWPDAAPHPADAATRPGRITPIVFSTQGVDPRHRFELWRSKYESFNLLTPLGPADTPFDGCNEIWPFGGMALLRNSVPAMAFQRDLRHVRRDSIDHWVIRVLRRGRSRMRIGDAVIATAPGRPVLFTLGQPHQGDRSDTDWTSLYIPRDSQPEVAAGLDRLGNRVLEGPGAGLLADFILLLERRMGQATLAEAPMIAESTRAMVVACLLHGSGCGPQDPPEVELTRRERVRRVIRMNIGSATLGPDKLCRLSGISRSQLYRLFEPHGGVARYIQAQRMRLARTMLEDAECRLTVSEIAERVGHFEASAFSRAFRQEFGCTPTEVRAAAQAGLRLPLAANIVGTPGGADFVGVLQSIGAAPEPMRPAA